MTEKAIVQQLVSALDELLPEFEPENADELYDALTSNSSIPQMNSSPRPARFAWIG